MLRRLETLVDPFTPFAEGAMPPTSVTRFTLHYLRPIFGWLAVLFALSVAVGVLESSLYLGIGWFVDILARAEPERLLADHGVALAWAAAIVVVLRPC